MLKPLNDRVIIEISEGDTTTASGIVLPDTAKEKPQQGVVIAVSDGKYIDGKKIDLDVKVGDHIFFSKYAGTEVKYEGKEYLIVRDSDILAIIEK